jgi:hypothetical protein
LIDPSFADGAHGQFPNGNGAAATQRLTSLAERLNVPYSSLAAALDNDSNNGNNVQQSSAVAITITRPSPGAVGAATLVANLSTVGWSYSAGKWGISSNSASGHTVYAVGVDRNGTNQANGGNVKLTGNVGSNGNPIAVTILTTGSIEIGGNANIVANLTNLQSPFLPPFVQINPLLVAVEDIQIRGDATIPQIEFNGVCFAGEQVDMSGNGSINGQVIVLGNADMSGSAVSWPNGVSTRSEISGSFQLTLNDGNSVGRIKLFSWRQIKR